MVRLPTGLRGLRRGRGDEIAAAGPPPTVEHLLHLLHLRPSILSTSHTRRKLHVQSREGREEGDPCLVSGGYPLPPLSSPPSLFPPLPAVHPGRLTCGCGDG